MAQTDLVIWARTVARKLKWQAHVYKLIIELQQFSYRIDNYILPTYNETNQRAT